MTATFTFNLSKDQGISLRARVSFGPGFELESTGRMADSRGLRGGAEKMCGIAGAVGRLDAEIHDAVDRAGLRMAHRGPDADGSWSSSEAGPGASFTHRRLAIIDLSPAGVQPMIDPETGNVICFNGEIYNFAALRKELEAAGVRFRSEGDTEVLLRGYAHWGRAVVERLRGMFAFALWDAAERRVLLARDRLGIKPLYLASIERPGGRRVLLFASEVRALLASGLVSRRLSQAGLSSYLWNGFVVGPHSIVHGVRQLAAGSSAWVDAEGNLGAEEPFWELPVESEDPEAEARLAEALHEAVALRLVSDVPVGVFLSGGIDSSAVASLAVRASSNPVHTFNIAFDEGEFDESPHARAVAAALGTDHHELRLSQSLFHEQLESALCGLDQPTFDGINTYFVSRAVREAGITVALSGAGGDELFGGYRSFRDLPRAARWSAHLSPVPAPLLRVAGATAGRLLSGGGGPMPPQTRYGKLGDALAARGDLVSLYQISYGLFSESFLDQLWNGEDPAPTERGLPPQVADALRLHVGNADSLAAISALELHCFVGERLLRDTDTASMAVALEARVPLLDHEVVEAAAALPRGIRYADLGSKQPLRDIALSNLDPALFDRPKSGFVLPLEVWTREALKGEMDSAFRDSARCEAAGLAPAAVSKLWQAWQQRSPGLYWSRLWSLYTLLHWTRNEGVHL
jgi:asparagine synthase (glutamine-hydrolysing)